MLTINPIEIHDESNVRIGTRYKIAGELHYGIEEENIKEITSLLEKVEKDYLADVIAFDFIKLNHWDSLGIRAVVPSLLKLNEILTKKERVLIGIIGDIDSDIYAALKDKYPDISDDKLPWYPDVEKFMDVVLTT